MLSDRLKEIRKDYQLTQTALGEKIGVKGNTITNYENGTRNPSDAIIKAYCRELGVNKEWLVSGVGEKYHSLGEKDDKLSTYVSQITDSNDNFIKSFIEVYWELDEPSKEIIRKLAFNLAKKYKKKKD